MVMCVTTNVYTIICPKDQSRTPLDKKFKKAVTKKNTAKTSYTISKLKKGKIYYVRIRAYKMDSTGKKVYGKYSSMKKVKVSK